MSLEATPPEPQSQQPSVSKDEAQAALNFLRTALQPPMVRQLAANGTWESFAQIQHAHGVLSAYLS
jgi:DNA-binding GntR family transcriptional regulator